MLRCGHDALLQLYKTKLDNRVKTYQSMTRAVELRRQQDVLDKLSSQLQETVAQRDSAQRQLSEKYSRGIRYDVVCYLSQSIVFLCINWQPRGLD